MSAAEDEVREVAVPDQALLQAISKAELDQHITTARAFPRSVKEFKKELMELATLDMQTADECIYALPRREKDKATGKWVTKNIEGPSARFAELVLYTWGNCRGGARVVAEERDFIVAQGIFHDLQKNTHITFEVRRRITTSEGRRYNSDMIGVTGTAASSIALRNSILKGVPKALWNPEYEAARKVCVGDQKTLANYRAEAMQYLQKLGATPEMVFNTLGVKGLEDIGLDELAVLKGLATSIREGETTVEKAFAAPEEEASPKGYRAEQAKDALRKTGSSTTEKVDGDDKIPHNKGEKDPQYTKDSAIAAIKAAKDLKELSTVYEQIIGDFDSTKRALPVEIEGAFTDRKAVLEQKADR